MKDEQVVFGNPNYQGPFGNTLLHGAVTSGDIQGVEQLLAAGADPGIANRDGQTPVDIAVIMGHRSISNLLMRHRSHRDVQSRGPFDERPLRG
jgi:ankyrin repeat protein